MKKLVLTLVLALVGLIFTECKKAIDKNRASTTEHLLDIASERPLLKNEILQLIEDEYTGIYPVMLLNSPLEDEVLLAVFDADLMAENELNDIIRLNLPLSKVAESKAKLAGLTVKSNPNSPRQQLLQVADYNDRQSMFRNFSKHDRSKVWSEKLLMALTGNTYNFQQKQCLIALHVKNKVSVWKDNPSNNPDYTTFCAFEASWRGLALNHFSEDELFSIIGLPDDINLPGVAAPSRNVLVANECTCSRTSDWCGRFQCNNDECEEASWGCGTFWAYNCDGICGGVQHDYNF